MDDKIKCELCGNYFKVLGQHLWAKHHTDVPEYQRRFPSAPVVSKNTSEKISKVNKEIAQNDPERFKELARIGSKAGHTKRKADPAYAKKINEKKTASIRKTFSQEKYQAVFAQTGQQLQQWKEDHPEDASLIYRENLMKWRRDPNNKAQIDAHNRQVMGQWGTLIEAVENHFGIEKVRGGLENGFLDLLGTLKDVRSVQYEPFRIPVQGMPRGYKPDFLVNGSLLFEVKPIKYVNDATVQRKAKAARAYAVEHGLHYMFVTEQDIFVNEERKEIRVYPSLSILLHSIGKVKV